MHPDIEKLISIAKESGELTAKQKEIILRKAEKLGEDVDEVEMLLESIRPKQAIKEPTKVAEKRMKCPNCGAIISETSFKCPECGYVLQRENKASEDARSVVNRLQEKLTAAAHLKNKSEAFLDPTAPVKRQASVVNTFTMPTTKEGLTQLLEFAYSNYISIGNGYQDIQLKPLKNAWYGKTMQAYNTLARIGGNDPEIQSLLANYSSLISKEKKKLGGFSKLWIWWLVAMLALGGIVYLGVRSDDSAKDQVEICIQNHDFQGAKAAAQKYSGDVQKLIDDISAQEVTYLISIGEIKQAKVVAASISDKEKRESMLSAIDDAEWH